MDVLKDKNMKKEDKNILIELICKEQTNMIVHNCTSHNSEKYKQLERIKIEIKELNE